MSAAAAILCLGLATGGAAGTAPAAHPVALPTGIFTLSWQHSVEKIEWRETWRVTAAGLEAVQASVRGSGAGMEPPPGARLREGWYVYVPAIGTVPEIIMPDSGFSRPGTLCVAGTCRPLAAWAGREDGDMSAVRLWAGPCEVGADGE